MKRIFMVKSQEGDYMIKKDSAPRLNERWEYVLTYIYNSVKRLPDGREQIIKKEIPFYDANHFIDQGVLRFSHLSMADIKNVLFLGMKQINKDYKLQQQNYMIISRSKDVKIPLDLRLDRKTNHLIGVLSTVLNKREHPYNTRREKEIIVESKKTPFIYEYQDIESEKPFTVTFFNDVISLSYKEINV